MRAQYHFRPSSRGLLAWDVRRLIELSAGLPIRTVSIKTIAELDEAHWYSTGEAPTCRSLVEHFKLVRECDLSFPIILDQSGRVMDGMHRVCKAILEERSEVLAVQFVTDPDPDYVGCDPGSLPYD